MAGDILICPINWLIEVCKVNGISLLQVICVFEDWFPYSVFFELLYYMLGCLLLIFTPWLAL